MNDKFEVGKKYWLDDNNAENPYEYIGEFRNEWVFANNNDWISRFSKRHNFTPYKEPRIVVSFHNAYCDTVSNGFYSLEQAKGYGETALFQIKLTVNLDDKTVESEAV